MPDYELMDDVNGLKETLQEFYSNIGTLSSEQLEAYLTEHTSSLKVLPLQEYEEPLITMYLSSSYREFIASNPLQEALTCSVCMGNYDPDDNIIHHPGCHLTHVYHETCLVIWFRQAINCPLCKNDFREHFLRKMHTIIRGQNVLSDGL